ncbi:MAG: hypothetical protein H6Q14_1803 [Bacteroidetes bacterium]|jgi:hypothetical protein|nr:hypothetical protein [Bacteroidota bacterium]
MLFLIKKIVILKHKYIDKSIVKQQVTIKYHFNPKVSITIYQ